jgi:hypothetical protein
VWRRVTVTILARGLHVSGSTGNMDSYLAIVLNGKNHEETVARLVHYYPSFQTRVRDDEIAAGTLFHLRVTSVDYCAMGAKDFFIEHVFDEEAVARILEPGAQNPLPCFLVRE